jgi:hypothetical protein
VTAYYLSPYSRRTFGGTLGRTRLSVTRCYGQSIQRRFGPQLLLGERLGCSRVLRGVHARVHAVVCSLSGTKRRISPPAHIRAPTHARASDLHRCRSLRRRIYKRLPMPLYRHVSAACLSARMCVCARMCPCAHAHVSVCLDARARAPLCVCVSVWACRASLRVFGSVCARVRTSLCVSLHACVCWPSPWHGGDRRYS